MSTLVKKKVGRPRKDRFIDIDEAIFTQEREEGQIRLEKTLKKTAIKLGPERFLIKFFKEYNNSRNTIYVISGEEEEERIQTKVGKRRSLGDIYRICNYYFPTITLKEVIQLLYVTLPAALQGQGFRTSLCSQIHKRVWYFDNRKEDLISGKTQSDEYGHSYDWYISNLTRQ